MYNLKTKIVYILKGGVLLKMSIVVRAGTHDTPETVIKKFQKRVALEGVIFEYREREFHKKDSERRQERMKEKKRKIRRAKRFAAL